MLKLAVVECKQNNSCYWSFADEFTKKFYGGRTFQTMIEAVEYANNLIVYKGNCFDLVDINQPKYLVLDSLTV